MKNKGLKKILIVCILLVSIIILFLVWYNTREKPEGISDEDLYYITPKKYEINEYSTVLITDEEMIQKYLNDYIYYLRYDINKAYYLLDENYRNKKFPSIDDFSYYINGMLDSITIIDRYKKVGKIYYLYDMNDNMFVFSTKGVMTYKVYFDDKTVEITAIE